MPVIRKRLYATEGAPSGTRVNPETGEVETTPDGGATWIPNLGADPRSNPAYQLPTVEGNHCPAAGGMVLQMRDFVTGVFGGTTGAGIAGGALFALTAMIPGAGWMFSVALIIASVVIAAGAGIIQASFTEGVWDELLCLLFSHLDADGLFTQEALEAFIADVYDQLGDSVGFGVAQMIQAWGFVGFNNAGILRADPEADCSGCPVEWCELLDFAVSDYGFELQYGTGEYVLGSGWETRPGAGGAFEVVAALRLFDAETQLTYAEVTYDFTAGSQTCPNEKAVQLSRLHSNDLLIAHVVPYAGGDSPETWEGDLPFGSLYFQLEPGCLATGTPCGGSAIMRSILIKGYGTPPGIGVACE